MKILLIIFILHNVNALDPAAYGNPSGQLSTQDPVPNLEYQARYTINVLNRAENCFFLENLKEGYIVNIHYLVISTKNGNQLDISMRLKDAQNKLITFQARKREGHFTNYQVISPGDYELCFNNKYSMYESKKLMWEVDVVGDENENVAEIVKAFLNRTMEVFEENSKEIMTTVTKVRHSLARARHQQYWIKSKNSKDAERLESLQGMVDTWSIVYSGLVCAVGVGQILVLRSFFNIKPATSQLKMRT